MSRESVCTSRRSFVVGTVAVGAGLVSAGAMASRAQADDALDPAAIAAGYAAERYGFRSEWLGDAPVVADDEIADVIECEIAVIGCGHAGSALTRRAAELGASVVTVEAQDEESFAAFGSDIGHLNSNWQLEQGIPEADPTEYLSVFQTLAANRANNELIRAYAQRSGEAFDWLLEALDEDQVAEIRVCNWPLVDGYAIQCGTTRAYPGTAKLNTDRTNTTALLKGQQALAMQSGARILYGTKAVVLVKDGDRVAGLVAQTSDGSYVKIEASKAVVLAAGDFAGNPAMFTSLITEASELNPGVALQGMGRDGSGIKMGLWAGGIMEPGPRAAMGANVASPASPVAAAGLWLNARGERYCNEGWGHPFIAGVQGARQPFGPLYTVFDANWKTMLTNQLTGHGDPMFFDDAFCDGIQATLDEAVAAGDDGYTVATPMASYTVYAADTIEGLAERLGLDPGAFAETVGRYNQMCSDGKDTDFAKDPSLLFPVDTPPFYAGVGAHEPGGRILVTLAGLFVDGGHRVLGEGFEPVPGLYAVGNCSGGRFPLQYTAPNHGASLGMANTLGYVLGEQLAG